MDSIDYLCACLELPPHTFVEFSVKFVCELRDSITNDGWGQIDRDRDLDFDALFAARIILTSLAIHQHGSEVLFKSWLNLSVMSTLLLSTTFAKAKSCHKISGSSADCPNCSASYQELPKLPSRHQFSQVP